MEMKSMERQMDGLYSLVQARHTEVLAVLWGNPAYAKYKSRLTNVAQCLAAALDSLQFCSEEFAEMRKDREELIGECLVQEMIVARGWADTAPVIHSEGPDGEPFNPLGE
jgi:hypothetical protein